MTAPTPQGTEALTTAATLYAFYLDHEDPAFRLAGLWEAHRFLTQYIIREALEAGHPRSVKRAKKLTRLVKRIRKLL